MPTLIKWPGVIQPGTIINDIGAHEDMLPTLLAAAGDPNVVEDLRGHGETINGRDYKVHLDGYDLRPALEGKADWPRKSFIYWTDGGDVAALRWGNWKAQLSGPAGPWPRRLAGALRAPARAPILTNLRMDPFEKARDEDAMGYQRWYIERMYMFIPAMAYMTQWSRASGIPCPHEPGSFDLGRAMDAMNANRPPGVDRPAGHRVGHRVDPEPTRTRHLAVKAGCRHHRQEKSHALIAAALACSPRHSGRRRPPLPSWTDGPHKTAILEFVEAVTDPKAATFVPPEDRIAVFDNDGTLWAEQPLYFQFFFALDQARKKAAADPAWASTPALKAAAAGDVKAGAGGRRGGAGRGRHATNSGMSVEDFTASVAEWLATDEAPADRPALYRDDLSADGRTAGHTCAMRASRRGSSRAAGWISMRAFTDSAYGIPHDRSSARWARPACS